MKFAQLIDAGGVLLNFEAADKWEAIRLMVDRLVQAGRVPETLRKSVVDALVARENLSSTGMDHGIALPHAQVEGLPEATAAVAVSPRGIEFQCSDGRPASLIALLLIPRRNIKQHIRTLAGIARLLNYEDMRSALMQAKTPQEAAAILKAEEEKEFA